MRTCRRPEYDEACGPVPRTVETVWCSPQRDDHTLGNEDAHEAHCAKRDPWPGAARCKALQTMHVAAHAGTAAAPDSTLGAQLCPACCFSDENHSIHQLGSSADDWTPCRQTNPCAA